jgi:hypothetical protein
MKKERRNILYIDGPLINKKGFIYEGNALTFNKDITYYNTKKKDNKNYELWNVKHNFLKPENLI